jgi:hypothetical protein
MARAPQGLRASLKGLACSVAIVSGITMPIAGAINPKAQIMPTISIKQIANYQLTDKQYNCHNAIIYKESRWNLSAVNGSHYGLYQGKSISLKGAPAEYQFWWYWYYVTNRYGVTKYDEPNYCNALHHLHTHGWQ